ncbi:hypothetical protein FRC08_018626 [Ceratobasidium sp. 394]|nr:hypothetical protein FRC08_018626 [Ceratobasidium sp. 394]
MASTSDARLHGSASTHPTVSGSMSGSSLVMSDTWIGFTRGLVLLTDPSIHRYAPSLVPRALILVPPKPTRHRACQVYAVWALRQPTVSVPVGDVRNPAVMSAKLALGLGHAVMGNLPSHLTGMQTVLLTLRTTNARPEA